MILVIMHMKVPVSKRREVSQTITSLIDSIRGEKGCGHCAFFQGLEEENVLCLLEEWDTRQNFEAHRKSERFKVLRGAMSLLEEPGEMIIYRSFERAESEEKVPQAGKIMA